MIRINLLPVRQTRKIEAVRREVLLGGFVGAVVIGLCLLGYIGLQVKKSAVGSRNQDLNAEIARLSADVARVDEMEKFKQELQRKLSVIDDLRVKRTGPVHMLDELAIAAPEKLQLTALSQQGDNLTIEGLAASNEIISQFLRSLDNSQYFDQVFLVNIEAKQDDLKRSGPQVVLKAFKVTSHITTPAVEAAKEKALKEQEAKEKGEAAPAPAPAAAPAPAPATGGGT